MQCLQCCTSQFSTSMPYYNFCILRLQLVGSLVGWVLPVYVHVSPPTAYSFLVTQLNADLTTFLHFPQSAEEFFQFNEFMSPTFILRLHTSLSKHQVFQLDFFPAYQLNSIQNILQNIKCYSFGLYCQAILNVNHLHHLSIHKLINDNIRQ